MTVDSADSLPALDRSAVAWSRRGAYMTLSRNVGKHDHPGRDHDIEPGLYVCDVSGLRLWRSNGVFCVLALRGDDIVDPVVVLATPDVAALRIGEGTLEVTWDGTDTMSLRAVGTGIALVQSVIDPLLRRLLAIGAVPEQQRARLRRRHDEPGGDEDVLRQIFYGCHARACASSSKS